MKVKNLLDRIPCLSYSNFLFSWVLYIYFFKLWSSFLSFLAKMHINLSSFCIFSYLVDLFLLLHLFLFLQNHTASQEVSQPRELSLVLWIKNNVSCGGSQRKFSRCMGLKRSLVIIHYWQIYYIPFPWGHLRSGVTVIVISGHPTYVDTTNVPV